MNTKTVATVLVVGLASGAAGYGTAILGGSPATVTRADRDQGRRELEAQLARVKDELRELRKPRPDNVANKSPAKVHADASSKLTRATNQRRPARTKVREAAESLKVSTQVMEAAIRAENAIATNADETYDLINELKRFGEEGFRAALAIVWGEPGQPQERLLSATFLVGLEGLLLETLDSAEASSDTKSVAIRALAKADTPAVRDHLVQRIGRERNQGLFWSLVLTLGSLKEPRAAAAVGKKLLVDDPIKDSEWKPLRVGLLAQLGRMGGANSKSVLRDFLRDARVTRGDEITQALNSLSHLDRPLCGELAHLILQEPRGKALSEKHEQRVRDFLVFRQR